MLAQGQHCPRSTLAYAVKQRVMMGIVTEREKEAQNRFRCRFVEHSGEERETEKEGAVEFVIQLLSGWKNLARFSDSVEVCLPVLLAMALWGIHLYPPPPPQPVYHTSVEIQTR